MKVFNFKSDYAHQANLKALKSQIETEPNKTETVPTIIPETDVRDQVQGRGEREAVAEASESIPQKKKKKTKKENGAEIEQPEKTL